MPRAKLSNVSLKQLMAELKKRQAKLADLVAQRDELTEQIAELEAVAGVETAPAKRRGRPPGKAGKKGARAAGKPLVEYVRGALAKVRKGLSVKEIEAKVLAAGYPTKAETIYGPIMKVLATGFKKVERGVYALKKGAAAAVKAAAAPRKAGRKRGVFKETAEQFVLGLAKGGGATSAQVNKKWKAAGRAGTAAVTLSKLTKAGKLKREKLAEGKGSTYTLA